jgi:hypothetical protein
MMHTPAVHVTAPPSFARKKLQDLRAAIQETWFYAACGIGGGLLLALLSLALEHAEHPDLGLLAEHLGMGLIVAGFAVVMYEWGGHFKPGLKLSAELDAIRAAVGFDALDRALHALLKGENGEHDRELHDELTHLVTQVHSLYSAGDWACYGYAQYLCEMLKDTGRNAESLSEVSTKLRANPASNASYAVQVHSPSTLSDIMLAEQMKRLPEGGSYRVVSNLGAWAGERLSRLHAASELAVARGVTIHRIFVLTHTGTHGSNRGTEPLKEVLNAHLAAMNGWKRKDGKPGYEVRIFEPARYVELQSDRSLSPAVNTVWTEHFGMFANPGENHLVLVQVNEPDLSDLQISGLKLDSIRIKRFGQVWQALQSTRLSKDLIKEAAERWPAGAIF